MNINQIKSQIDTYSSVIDSKKALSDLDKALKDNNINYSNIICIFTYNYETEIRFSLLTSPSYPINIICKKL